MEFPLTNPPTRLFAYINSYPDNKVIEATILPTKQRVMLGLGVGDEKSHAHHKYRRLYPHGYRLIWTDDPGTDVRLSGLKTKIEKGARELRDNGVIVTESDALHASQPTQDIDAPLDTTRQLTTDLMREGVEKAKSASEVHTRTATDDREKDPDPTRDEQGDDKAVRAAAQDRDNDTQSAPNVKPDFDGFF